MNLAIRRWPALLGLTGVLTCVSLPAWTQTLVKNPSFENNLNNTSAPLAPGAPQGWPYYSPIDDWGSGGTGVNDLTYDAGGPFHNAGTPVPDGRRIGFKQGSGSISQLITGLTPGLRYWIQFRYDARNGSDLDIAVRFSTVSQGGALDEELDIIRKPRPARATSSPYYSRTVPFVPDAEGGLLRFQVTSRGDSTALFDAVTIVQRDEGNFPVINPSFEASGVVFNGASSAGQNWPAISGWVKSGVAGVDDGTGGVADNGAIPDQGIVAFITGPGSLTQTLEPVVPGSDYTLEFAYNAKSGSTPHLIVMAGGAVLWEGDVAAVGGSEAYRTQSLTFRPGSDISRLTFSNSVADASVLIDNVKVLGAVGERLPPLAIAPAKTMLRVGESQTGSVTIPAERVTGGRTAVVKIRSTRPNVLSLADTDVNGVLSLSFNAATLSKPFSITGLNVGSAGIEIVDSAGLPLPEDITAVWIGERSFVLNPSFEIDKDSGVGTRPITYWTTSGGNIGIGEAANPFLSANDFGIPDRNKLLRMQGGGTVSQVVSGLVPGRLYGLQFFYNGRSVGFPYVMSLRVSLGGQVLLEVPEVVPAKENSLTSFYFHEARFTAASATALLEFKATVSSGDASLFLDAVSIVPRVEGELAVMNSSFEASASGANWPGYLSGRIAGWGTPSGGGYGVNGYSATTFFVEPFLDNGINSDQDQAFFGQGGVGIRQALAGLVPGEQYTLVFDYNFRDGRGPGATTAPNLGQCEVTLGADTLLSLEAPGVPPVDTISPYPGFRHTKPFYQAFLPFIPVEESGELRIKHIGVNGDETMLLDNVRVVPGTRTPPAITVELTDVTAEAGGNASFAVTAPGAGHSYSWYRNGVLLRDGTRIQGATTDTLNLSALSLQDAGTYSVIVSDGVGVAGSTAVLAVNPATAVVLSIRRTGATITLSWAASATDYRLQQSEGLTGPWQDVTQAPVPSGANLELEVSPVVGRALFFRLIR
ncbi:MAG: hypothetical protein FJ405_12895 [Verrucomicrobia bacterium]|nr:hypothetical protein [Verrucomicrobiota bacterium]